MFLPISHTQKQNYGFLDVSGGPHRSLKDIFNTATDPILRKSPPVQTQYFETAKVCSQDGCSGPIDVSLAEDYCDALDDLKQIKSVAFSKDRLVKSLTGGSCSAMAFQFADDYLRKKSYASAEEIINEIGPKYERSSRTFRTIQAVFNTIHKDVNHHSDDFMRDKIGSMLRFYDLKISHSSDLFFTRLRTPKEDAASVKKIKSFLDQFEEGVFVVRCLFPKDNHKEEASGHSTTFIKTAEAQYFYDPDKGIFKLTKGFEAEGLHQLAKMMMLRSDAPFGRIYKIEEPRRRLSQ